MDTIRTSEKIILHPAFGGSIGLFFCGIRGFGPLVIMSLMDKLYGLVFEL